MTAVQESSVAPPTILSFAKDLANLCSLAGLFSAVLAIYFAITNNFPAAMIGLVWAVFFDWSDGNIARRMKNRTDNQRMFGGQLDSLIDIVSFGVCPAVVLLSYGDFHPWFLPGAFIIVAAGVLRLSYFNVYGLVSKTSYQGLAIDNNGILLALLFVFHGLISSSVFTAVLYILILTLAALNVSPVKTPKLSSGAWYYGIVTYTLILTIFYSWQLLK
ncbi:phosphatidylserine synthase [Solemya velum gill symbiont]|uniref:Phosphatidylserine synthase n=1 Tax=Solemya velum gill symbiont TaxID=2340 RepID=A0A0B0HAW6_SOVGS|nr:CDP-alcohol phosphatidyltransferase family protein [Solemya velum gill symbiont]KHF25802.1 phosphatidylserine synthase [Solemya velum gill symbiont]